MPNSPKNPYKSGGCILSFWAVQMTIYAQKTTQNDNMQKNRLQNDFVHGLILPQHNETLMDEREIMAKFDGEDIVLWIIICAFAYGFWVFFSHMPS